MRLSITHTTHYRYDAPVPYGLQQLRKTPKTAYGQRIVEWETEVSGGRKEVSYDDHHNNRTELINFDRDTQTLDVTSRGIVEISDAGGVLGAHRGPAPLWLYLRSTESTRAGPGVRAMVRDLEEDEPLARLHALSEMIRTRIPYRIGVSESDWSAEDTIEAGFGVCQDHSHVFLACARRLGIPARYVSGYLMLDDRTAQEAMHAWVEAHVDGLGWVGFDVSNGISPDGRYVRVATGLDYIGAAPVSGTRIGDAGESLDVRIDVAQQ